MLVRKKIVLSFLLILISSVLVQAQVDNRINYNDQDLWLNGGNVAWVNFASDVGPGTTAFDDFEAMFTQVRENGGNAMRFWVHINGKTTPTWNGNEVTGLGAGTIEDLEAILDMALDNNVGMVLSLWSFDMLRTSAGSTVTSRARAMLEDSTLTEKYIQNSLVPMVEAVGNHPSVIAWEIFNEPEGMATEFGFDGIGRTPMVNIQRFINQTAGAIHRTNPEAKVTNGAWSFHSLSTTSRSKSKNYYSDTELISTGKDSLGYLDFYQVHYYSWAGTTLSPFHNDKSSWGLNKPLIVGEFGVPGSDLFGIPKEDLYETLYDRGYAGALVWQWVDWYQDRGTYGPSWLRGLEQMSYMKDTYPEDINIINTNPIIRSFESSLDEIESGGQTELTWEIDNSVSATINDMDVDAVGSRIETLTQTTTFTLIGIGTEGDADTAFVTINVVPAGQINRALGQPARASTTETCCGDEKVASLSFDGDESTRWSSAWEDGSGGKTRDENIDSNPDDEWIDVDLGAAHEVSSVLLNWETAYSSLYDIETSIDGVNWEVVYSETNSNGGIDSIAFAENKFARFVRMHGKDRATEFGHSLWEFEVRGAVSVTQPPQVVISNPSDGKGVPVGSSLTINADATDADGDVESVSFFFDGDSVGVDLTAPFSFTVSEITEGVHTIYAKATDDDNFVVQSATTSIEARTDIYNVRFEAENATLSGATSKDTGTEGASEGSSVYMQGSGSIKWDNLNLPEGDEYELNIRYYLPFEYKEQFLKINGETVDTLAFGGPIEVWQTLTTTITSALPIQSIAIERFYGYMNFDFMEVTIENVTVSNEGESDIPSEVVLNQNYPNPFNPSTTINYSIAKASNVQLSVYNLIGQRVATLVDKRQSAGSHSIEWNASSVSSGIYFYKIVVGQNVLSKKMVLIK